MVLTVAETILGAATTASIVYWIVCLVAASRFFAKPSGTDSATPPASILIPLYGADFDAYENYAGFCRQEYPEFQLVFGVLDGNDSSIPVVQKLKEDFPQVDIALSVCSDIMGSNLKVSNLANMLRVARHEVLIIVDSDIRVGRDYLGKVASPLADPKVGLVTCLYRAGNAPDLGCKLEAIGISSDFAAGVLAARMLDGMKFSLGATMATTRTKLEAIGGFRALANFLADDYMLGHLLAKAGFEVRLSPYVVETVLSPGSLSDAFRHQLRWARVIRICRPWGYLGMSITFGVTLAVIHVLLSGASAISLALLAAAWIARMVAGWTIGVRHLHDRILKRYFWMVPLRDAFSLLVWCVSWVGTTVEWRGKHFTVRSDGTMAEV